MYVGDRNEQWKLESNGQLTFEIEMGNGIVDRKEQLTAETEMNNEHWRQQMDN